MITPTLHTERLDLRPPKARDIDAYRAFYAVSDLEEGHYRGGRKRTEIDEILKADIAQWRAHGVGMFLLFMAGTARVAGGTGIRLRPDWPHELTWWLMPGARGKGLAQEASRAVIEWLHCVQGWTEVQTFMRDGNGRARVLAERLGAKIIGRQVFPDGVTRDLFALPAEVSR